jgi:hypothetical protein
MRHGESGLLRLCFGLSLTMFIGFSPRHGRSISSPVCLFHFSYLFVHLCIFLPFSSRNMIKTWVDPVTAEKIRILGTDFLDHLREQIDDEEIPVELGGSCSDFRWSWPYHESSGISEEQLGYTYTSASVGQEKESGSTNGLRGRGDTHPTTPMKPIEAQAETRELSLLSLCLNLLSNMSRIDIAFSVITAALIMMTLEPHMRITFSLDLNTPRAIVLIALLTTSHHALSFSYLQWLRVLFLLWIIVVY